MATWICHDCGYTHEDYATTVRHAQQTHPTSDPLRTVTEAPTSIYRSTMTDTAPEISLYKWDKAPYVFISNKNRDKDLPKWLVRHPDDEGDCGLLNDELSYRPSNVQHTDRWRRGEDCNVYQLRQSKKGNWFFPIGHLDKVCDVLDALSLEYSISGGKKALMNQPYTWTGHDMRPYQQTAVNRFLQEGRGIISLPTGTGKTLIGLRIVYELDASFAVFCDQKAVANEWVQRIPEALGVEAAQLFGGEREMGDQVVALYQSCYDVKRNEDGAKWYEMRPGLEFDHDLVIFDEVHHVGAKAFSAVALGIVAPFRLGLSATPERSDGHTPRVVGGTGEVIVDLSPPEMIREGWLAQPEWDIRSVPRVGGFFEDWHDEYSALVVESEERNLLVTGAALDLVARGKTPVLVSVERIRHGEFLEAALQEVIGEQCRFVHGSSRDREEVIEGFKEGELLVLVTTLLKEGFDCPELLGFVNAGGLKSEIAQVQKVGRVLRKGSGESPVVVDFADSGRRVGKHFGERLRVYRDVYGEFGPK